jgi:hypothetical protein
VPGGFRYVLPTVRVAEQTVLAHHKYRFTVAPGHYVLAAHYAVAGSNIEPWVSVLVRVGKVTEQNIPNECR